jgi:hypothetical protein
MIRMEISVGKYCTSYDAGISLYVKTKHTLSVFVLYKASSVSTFDKCFLVLDYVFKPQLSKCRNAQGVAINYSYYCYFT